MTYGCEQSLFFIKVMQGLSLHKLDSKTKSNPDLLITASKKDYILTDPLVNQFFLSQVIMSLGLHF